MHHLAMEQSESRTAKSVRNGMVAIVFFAINLILQFFSRKIFLIGLGNEILGLNSTLANMLEFLNLAELGIGTAIGFSLFEPLHRNDRATINEIITLQGMMYRRIGLGIMAVGMVLSAFFPLIFAKADFPIWYAYASFYAMLLSTMLGYFFNYKQVILSASQQEYRIICSFRATQLVKVTLQMLAVSFLDNCFIWWVGLEAIFALISSITLHIATVRAFPFFDSKSCSYKNLRIKYASLTCKIKQLFFHKIGSFALYQSSPLIIYAFISLTEVTLYMNYMLITAGILQLFNAIFNGVGAGVGNMVAEQNEKLARNVFKEIFSLRFVSSWITVLLFIMTSGSFVSLWIGDSYILPPPTVILIGAILLMNLIRFTVDIFIQANGIYSDIYAPIAEAAINLSISIILGYFWKLDGILAGILISQIAIIFLWKPYYLLSRYPIMKFTDYISMMINHLITVAISSAIPLFIWLYIDSISNLTGLLRFLSMTVILAVTLTFFNSIGLILSGTSLKNAFIRLKSIRMVK